MARDALSRNLRDGSIIVEDGAAADLTLVLENGDLEWTENLETREILDRGALDHTRPGDEQPCDLSYSVIWTQLIGETTGTGNLREFYEMITNAGSTYTTVQADGQQFMLRYVFNVAAPAAVGGTSEKITFNKVYYTALNLSEGGESNQIRFTGRDFETGPTVTRY